jgi:hypothetical protein
MSMYVCISVCLCVCLSTCKFRMHEYECVCVCLYMYMLLCLDMCVVYLYVYVSVCVPACLFCARGSLYLSVHVYLVCLCVHQRKYRRLALSRGSKQEVYNGELAHMRTLSARSAASQLESKESLGHCYSLRPNPETQKSWDVCSSES